MDLVQTMPNYVCHICVKNICGQQILDNDRQGSNSYHFVLCFINFLQLSEWDVENRNPNLTEICNFFSSTTKYAYFIFIYQKIENIT